jgi:hypothetical protein
MLQVRCTLLQITDDKRTKKNTRLNVGAAAVHTVKYALIVGKKDFQLNIIFVAAKSRTILF